MCIRDRSETSRASLLASRLESSPYATFCLGPDVVTCLLGAAVDSWDRLRAGAFRLLSKHPAPLAGIRRSEDVAAHFKWALALSRSPRVRESDAAALLLRLLFRKYAVDGGWTVTLTPEVAVVAPPPREEKETSVSPAKNGTAARSGGGGERRTRTAKLLGARSIYFFRVSLGSRLRFRFRFRFRFRATRKKESQPSTPSLDARKRMFFSYVLVLSERIGEVATRAEDGGVFVFGVWNFGFSSKPRRRRRRARALDTDPLIFLKTQARCAT